MYNWKEDEDALHSNREVWKGCGLGEEIMNSILDILNIKIL